MVLKFQYSFQFFFDHAVLFCFIVYFFICFTYTYSKKVITYTFINKETYTLTKKLAVVSFSFLGVDVIHNILS